MSEVDELGELLELTRALHTHAVWQSDCGTVGLPRATEATWTERGVTAVAGSVEATERATLQSPAPQRPQALGAAPVPSAKAAQPREPSALSAPAVRPSPTGETLGAAPPRPPASIGPTEEAHRRLAVLASEVSGCTQCGLHARRKQTVFARGNGSSRLCFVGEGPGADEDEQGFPFVGKAGQLLDKMIQAMGLSRDEVYVCNIVKCRPPDNRKPEPTEIAACAPYLAEQLELIDPEVIVALGATAVEGLFGASGGITRMRGRWKTYKGVAVMPTFHPAYLLRNPAAKRDVWNDLQAVLRQMGRELPPKR